MARVIKQFDPSILVTATNQDHYQKTFEWQNYWNVFAKSPSSNFPNPMTNSNTPMPATAGDPSDGSYIDFYSVNTYEGAGAVLAIGGFNTFLNTYDSIPNNIKLPLFISEWGKYDTYDWGTFANQWGYNLYMRNLLQQAQKMSLLGSAYFEFADEPVAKNQGFVHYMGVVAYQLNPPSPDEGGGIGVDTIVPKYKEYAGIKVGDDGALQNYPGLGAGIFDSFIGNNEAKACIPSEDGGEPVCTSLTDPAISQVPNISYCAYSQSPGPDSIHPNCLKLDVSPKIVPLYTIEVIPAAGETISQVKMDGIVLPVRHSINGSGINYYLSFATGELNITVTSGTDVNKKIGEVKLGITQLNPFVVPSENNNTLMQTGLEGIILPNWNASGNNGYGLPARTLNVSMTPLK